MPVMTDLHAVATVKIDNARLRVTEWRFAPGAATGWHRHEHDYVVVPLYDGNLKIVEGGEEKIAELKKVYGLDYDTHASYRFVDKEEPPVEDS